MDRAVVSRLTVVRLGLAQLISWGVTFYLPGAFGNAITEDLGWSSQRVFSGLSVALLVMGLVSIVSARLIQRLGARQVLQAGAGLNALGCCMLALCDAPQSWFQGWAALGVGMRLSLYDALFAALAGLFGARSRPLMVPITLLGGLASAVFWPLGHGLLSAFGWRSAVAIYGCLALFSGLLVSTLPDARLPALTPKPVRPAPGNSAPLMRQLGYALGMSLIAFLSAGLSAHLPALLASFGVPVMLAALWGVGQTCARLAQTLLAQSMPALRLNVWVAGGMALCFTLGLFSQGRTLLACIFLFGYGAVNGLATLLRASLPFELFEHAHYAHLQGRLLAPAFLLSAAAPWFFAWVREGQGASGLMWLSLMVSLAVLVVAILLDRQGGTK
ncbi:putative membrane protein [Pseudomonas caricapapayae]|uniref:Putative membrane protein n=1 Tax=Pseudomonas caricapapayae TaxID=46678 RepID=A0A3M6EGC8_9PSED|nr:MFS transporter [Pseudomonas caricapapayae]RMV67267.1 putative membrane protein [Pseudomonas caricapapayae]